MRPNFFRSQPKEQPLTALIIFAAGVFSLLFMLRNPLLYNMTPMFDASLFAAMGKMWAEGRVLYRDMIDIKGPLIFGFDAVGYALGGWRGIWALEWLLCWTGVTATWHALRQLGFNTSTIFSALLMLFALYGVRYYYGNMTEDWTFHLALIGQWGFISLLCSDRFRWPTALITGLTFALVVWMRMNNGGLWGAWYLALFLGWLFNGRSGDALRLLGSSLMMIALVGAPLLYYFHINGVMAEFKYYAFSIFFEGSYGNGFSLAVGVVGLLRTGLFVLLPVTLWLLTRNQQPHSKTIFAVTLLGAIFTLIANSVSGHIFDHYDVLYLQLMVLPLALLIQASQNRQLVATATLLLVSAWLISQQLNFGWTHREWSFAEVLDYLVKSLPYALPALLLLFLWRVEDVRRYASGLAIVGCLAVMILNGYTGTQKGHPSNEMEQQRIDYIRTHSTPNDRIWIDYIRPQYYVWTDRQPASAYLFFSNVNPPYDVKERVLADLKRNQAKFIIVKPERLAETIAKLSSYSESTQAYYHYLQDNYREVVPGLYEYQGMQK